MYTLNSNHLSVGSQPERVQLFRRFSNMTMTTMWTLETPESPRESPRATEGPRGRRVYCTHVS